MLEMHHAKLEMFMFGYVCDGQGKVGNDCIDWMIEGPHNNRSTGMFGYVCVCFYVIVWICPE